MAFCYGARTIFLMVTTSVPSKKVRILGELRVLFSGHVLSLYSVLHAIVRVWGLGMGGRYTPLVVAVGWAGRR